MRAAAIAVAVGVAVAVFASIAFAVLRQDREVVAELELEPSSPGGPEGAGTIRHGDGRLTGWIVVWGLEPGSRHAVHFHGPDSACGAKADPIAAHADLEADADGVATARLDMAAPASVLERGVYYNVHAGPSTRSDNPEIACGDVSPISR
jgi:hypothetical protein